VARFQTQLVQRVGQPGKVLWRDIGSQVDVLCIEAPSVRLDRGASDQHECHTMTREHTEQCLSAGIYATGVCWLSQAWILSWSV
jgi:hypothetical protein